MYIFQNSAATQLSCIVFYLVTTLLLIFHKMCLWKNFENRSTIWSGQKCAAKLTFLATLYVPSSGSGQAEAECRAAWNWKLDALHNFMTILTNPCVFQLH